MAEMKTTTASALGIIEPPQAPTSPAIISPTIAEEKTSQNIVNLQNIQQQLESIRQQALKVQEETKKLPTPTPTGQFFGTDVSGPRIGESTVAPTPQLAPGEISKEQLPKTGGVPDSTGYEYNPTTGGFRLRSSAPTIPTAGTTATTTPTIPTELQNLINQQSETINRYNEEINRLKNFEVNVATRTMLNRIDDVYQRKIAAQKDLNRRTLEAIRTTGIRLGSRYTQEISAGLLSATEQQGLDTINALQDEWNDTIASAIEAQKKEDFTRLNKLMETAEEVNERKLTVLNEWAKEARKSADELEKKSQEAAVKFINETKVLAEVKSGETDLAKIFEKVNFDENGNLVDNPILPSDIASMFKTYQVQESVKNGVKVTDVLAQKYGLNPGSVLSVSEAQSLGILPKVSATEAEVSNEALDYYSQYLATNGSLPSGTPKNLVGDINKLAKTIPQASGTIVDAITGFGAKTNAGTSEAITAGYDLATGEIQNMIDAYDSIATGIIPGLFGTISKSDALTRFEDLRTSALSKLLKMRSGQAVTESEYQRLSALLPTRFSESLFGLLGKSAEVQLKDFQDSINNHLKAYLNNNGLKVVGYDSGQKVQDASKFDE